MCDLHLQQDLSEKLEWDRSIVEYAMAFHNLEAVRKVQEAREEENLEVAEQNDEIFSKQIEELFGRKIDFTSNVEKED